MIEELAMQWVKIQHKYTTVFESREVDCVYGKLFNTIDFYFVKEEDAEWYQKFCEEQHRATHQANYDRLVESKNIDPEIVTSWEDYTDPRTLWPDFISELSMTSGMVEDMRSGKNLKKIRK